MNISTGTVLLVDESEQSAGIESRMPIVEPGRKISRRMSLEPRLAGLGSTFYDSQDEKLERDLIHHENEKMSPRETPWATPRVSPRMGSFGSRAGFEQKQRSQSCTVEVRPHW